MRILLFLILTIGLNIFVNAQEKFSLLKGSVYDANGAVIVGAKIIAFTVIDEKMRSFETETKDSGNYELKLPYRKYDSSSSFRIYKFVLVVIANGFEKFEIKGFKFVPSYKGTMNLDFALDVANSNCGAGGCIPEQQELESNDPELHNKVIKKSFENLSKATNKNKRKTINNK